MSTQHTPGPQELSADSGKCRRWESLNNVITVTTPEAGALLVAAIALPAESAAIKSNEHAYTLARQIAREHNSYDDLLAALNNAPVPGTMAWMTWYEGERKVAIDKAEERP